MTDETTKLKPETMAEMHEKYLEDVAPKAQRIMNDEKLDFFRTRIRRRILAGVMLLVGFTMPVVMSIDMGAGWWGDPLPLLGLYVALIFLGSRVARGFMDLPKELVDERVRQRRQESYVATFNLIMLILVLIIPALLLSGVKSHNFSEKIHDPIGGIVGFLILVSALPIIVFLWREPEL